MEVGGVVDPMVVEPTEWLGFVEVGSSSCCPGISMVELGPGVGPVTAVGEAGGVSGGEGDLVCFGEEPSGATEVEWQ